MKSLVFTILFLILPVSVTFAQKEQADDGPVGIFNSRSEYHEFMGSAKRAAYGEGGNAELRAMIPMLNDIALNQPIGSTAGQYNAQGTTLGMLADENIRRDLEMVDDQYKELQAAGRDIQKRAAEQLRSLNFGDRERLMEQVRKMREGAQDELNELLLPHQIKRLRQIRFQSQVRRRSLVGILVSDPVKSDLDISDEQADELRVAEKEIQAEMQREIQKLREKAKEKLLARLKPTQKKEVEEMIGDAYDFKESDKVPGKRRAGKGGNKNKPDKK